MMKAFFSNFPLVAFLTLMVLLFSGCGKPAEEAAKEPAPKDLSSIVPPPPEFPSKDAVAPRHVYVATAFQTRSELGIHDFPVGCKVTVTDQIGDDYVVEYIGVSAQVAKTFFSETPVEVVDESMTVSAAPVATPTPVPESTPFPSTPPMSLTSGEPVSMTNSLGSIDDPVPASTPDAKAAPVFSPVPPPELTEEDRKVSELSEEIRDLNEKIRTNADESSTKSLRQRRDELSEELTTYTKP